MTKSVKKLTIADIFEYVTPYAECVSSTYGPNGANVLIQTDSGQMITKDGVTVSNSLVYSDPVQFCVVDVLKQAAMETVSKVGDGTTSTVIVAHSLLKKLAEIEDYNELKIKKVIDAFSEKLEDSIKKYGAGYTVTAEDIRRVINISTNGDEQVTNCVYDAVMHTGVNGHIIIKNSSNAMTFLEHKEGYEMPSGYFGPTFVNNSAMDCTELENPLILITDMIIEDQKILHKIASFADRAKRPIFVIADDVRGDALSFLAYNASMGLPVGLAKAPSYGLNRKELLEDLAIATGGVFFSSVIYPSLDGIALKDLGTCQMVQSGAKSTFFQECRPDVGKLMGRMEQLKSRVAGTSDSNEIERLQDRISRISSSIAAIYVGGLNDAERLEKKHRIDDAIESVKSIESYGVVPGAGSFYAHVAMAMMGPIRAEVGGQFPPSYDKLITEIHDAIHYALLSPSIKLISFARLDDDDSKDYENAHVRAKSNAEKNEFMGVNYQTDEEVDLVLAGIVEPTHLCINVICNALSAAGIMSTVKYINTVDVAV